MASIIDSTGSDCNNECATACEGSCNKPCEACDEVVAAVCAAECAAECAEVCIDVCDAVCAEEVCAKVCDEACAEVCDKACAEESTGKVRAKESKAGAKEIKAGSSAASVLRGRLVFAFNNFFADLLIAAKNSDELIKKRLKKSYRVIEPHSDAHLLEFWESCLKVGAFSAVFDNDDVTAVSDLHIAQSMPLAHLNLMDAADLLMHARLLCAVAYIFDEMVTEQKADGNDKAVEAACDQLNRMFEKFMQAVADVQSGGTGAEDIASIVDEEAHRRFAAVLRAVTACGGANALVSRPADRKSPGGPGGPGGLGGLAGLAGMAGGELPDGIMSMLQNSMLGEIAQEIASEVDMHELEEATKRNDMNAMMQHIMSNGFMSKITDKLTSKVASGRYKEADLMSEASKLLGSMGMCGK